MTWLAAAGGMSGAGAAGGHPAGMGMSGMGGMGSVPVDFHNLWSLWAPGPFACTVAAAAVAAVVWYLRARGRLRDRGRSWSTWRPVCFVAGVASVELGLGSSVAVLAGGSFSMHIVQHLLLMVVAPPLLALGAPMTLALQTSSRPTKVALLKALHSWPFAVVSHPVVVWFLYYGAMIGFFLSPALGFAMDHMAVMDVVNLGFLAGGTLFWWPMVGLDPVPRWRMGYGMRFLNLLAGIPFESFLGIALIMEARPVASMYTLAGTHAGGGLLWVASELSTAVALVPMFSQWFKADTRQGARSDARWDRSHQPAAEWVRPPARRPAGTRLGLAGTLAAMRREAVD
ncbi:MAG: cytochrome c oxidase assembly protein [Acidimicrobiales bacterium]